MLKNCKWCGKEYKGRGHRSKYCDECSKLPSDLLSGKTFDFRNPQICKNCGVEFYAKRKYKYCNKECLIKHQAKVAKQKRNEPDFKYNRKIYTKVCVECGNEYKTTFNKQQYCSTLCSNRKLNRVRRKVKKIEYRGKEHLNDWQYKQWRKEVYKKDNYICDCCGYSKGKTLNAHHLEGWISNIDLRYEVSNGITLCETCHIEFHKKYGYGNNTKVQYLKFKGSGNNAINN